MGGEPDKGPARNAITARGSSMTYLERYTLLAAVGMAVAGQDDDAQQAGALDDKVVTERLDWIRCAADLSELERVYKNAYKEAFDAKDLKTIEEYKTAKNKRKAELQ